MYPLQLITQRDGMFSRYPLQLITQRDGTAYEGVPHSVRHFVSEFMRSLVVIEWFGWKMPQGYRCQPYAGAYSQRAGVGEWTSKLPRQVHGCNSPVCVLLCLHTLVVMARQDSVWL